MDTKLVELGHDISTFESLKEENKIEQDHNHVTPKFYVFILEALAQG